ncbi:MAG: ankyrin repeat domain-containing protein [Acidobacteria bacterium]|nr:ankyrin repeat domain-containing protein [Acidobacteriota bacterium]
MGFKVKRLGGLWTIPILSVISLAAPVGNPPLIDAVKNKDQETVRSLLKQQADVNARQADGATALAWAAHQDDLETADLLIRAGADVNAANNYGATPLWLACSNGSAAMVEKLLKAGANPNSALLSGETGLMTTASIGSMDVLKLLVAHGVDVNAKEPREGQTALMWAVQEKHPEVVRMLIEGRADVHARSKSGFTPLLIAAREGDLDSAQSLLAAGADVNEATPEDGNALTVASSRGQEKLAMFLLEKGADLNVVNGKEGFTALHYAAGRGRIDLVNALLAHGANPNSRVVKSTAEGSQIGTTPFFMAATAHKVSVMRALVASGADPLLGATETVFLSGANGLRLQMVKNTTPLMAAAGGGRYKGNYEYFSEEEERDALEAVKLALELGGDVNASNDYGQTALHSAAYIAMDEIIEFLVEKGANIEAMDKFGQTPLSIAQFAVTVALGANYDMKPRKLNESTANLLLKLGATPLEASGVQVITLPGNLGR